MSSIKPNNDFLNQPNVKSDKEQYALYYSLDVNKKKCLDATNYWRVMSGLREIPVPESDTNYHKYFDKRCYDLCEKYQKMKKDKDSFFKTLAVNNKKVDVEIVEEIKEAEVKIEQKVEIAEKVEVKVEVKVVEVKVEQKVEQKVEKVVEINPIAKIEKPIEKPITKTKKKEINNNQQQSSLF